MAYEDFLGSAWDMAPSSTETERFGFPVERLVVHQDAPLPDPAIDAAVQASSASLIIARWPAQRYQMPRAVASWKRIVIPAGTLSYWGIACQGGPTTQKSLPPGARLASFESRQQNSGSIDAFEAIVRDSFDGYGNHYRANPYLNSSTVVEGYVEWALATLRSAPGSVLTLDMGRRAGGFRDAALRRRTNRGPSCWNGVVGAGTWVVPSTPGRRLRGRDTWAKTRPRDLHPG